MALNASGVSGVPRYAAALSRALDGVVRDFPDLEPTLVMTGAGAEAVSPTSIPVQRVNLLGRRLGPGAARLLLEQALPRTLSADLIHYFDASGPLVSGGRRFVLTFHDASVCHPDMSHFSRLQRGYKLRLLPWSLRRAAATVAVSRFAKDEAVRHFGADPTTITVVHSGPGMTLEPVASDAAPADARPYLLFVGNLTASKNVPFLVRAFDLAALPVDLILAGRPVEDVATIREAIQQSHARDRIHIRSMPSDRELDGLYRGAVALAFPSRYEGFGFPPLEAMARRCPVLMSDVPALQEVSGGGALVLPLQEDAWAEGIRRVMSDPTFREALVGRGTQAVARYSWEATARSVCEVLLRAGTGPSAKCPSFS